MNPTHSSNPGAFLLPLAVAAMQAPSGDPTHVVKPAAPAAAAVNHFTQDPECLWIGHCQCGYRTHGSSSAAVKGDLKEHCLSLGPDADPKEHYKMAVRRAWFAACGCGHTVGSLTRGAVNIRMAEHLAEHLAETKANAKKEQS